MSSTEIRIVPWGKDDLPLLEQLVGGPAMMEHRGGPESEAKIAERKLGFARIEECEFEYPPGHVMRSNDWRLDLGHPLDKLAQAGDTVSR